MPRRKHNPQPCKRLSAEGDEEAEDDNGDEDKARPVTPQMSRPSTPGAVASTPPAAMTRAAKRRRTNSPLPDDTKATGEDKSVAENEDKEKNGGNVKSTTQSSPTSTAVQGKSSGKKASSPKGKSPVPAGLDSGGSSVDSAEGASGEGDGKRNLSLEALFQVTHSELQNISRQGEHQPQPTRRKSATDVEKSPKMAKIVSKYVEDVDLKKTQPIILAVVDSSANTASSQEEQEDQKCHLVTSEGEIPEGPLQIEIQMENPEEEREEEVEEISSDTRSVLSLAAPDKEVTETQFQFQALEQQGLKMVYAKKPSYESNAVSIVTYKQGPALQKEVPQVIESGTVQVGRKRKHPQKPGRHICPYCGRGCAKPSVLQKHIRAHTGERPYPCVPCGFSFKTKSNLYKHCKSRAHAMKAGNSSMSEDFTGVVDESSKSRGAESEDSDVVSENEVEFIDDDGMSETGSDHIPKSAVMLVSETGQPISQSVALTSSARAVPLKVENQNQLVAQSSETGTVQWVDSCGTLVPVMTKVIMTDKQFYDIAQVGKDGLVLRSVAPYQLVQSSEDGDQATYAVITSDPNVEIATSGATSPTDIPATQAQGNATDKKGDSVTMTSTLQKFSDNSMKVTIQLPKLSSKPASLASPTVIKHAEPSTKISQDNVVPSPAVHVHSKHLPALHIAESTASVSSSVVPTPAPKLTEIDRKALTPEMLQERISRLISANAAIIDMPMADAPRPKRMSRQNSEVTPSSTPLAPRITRASSFVVESSSMDVTDMEPVTREVHHRRPPLLSQAAVVDEPECQVDTLVVAAAESEQRDSEMTQVGSLPVPVISIDGEELQPGSSVDDEPIHIQFAKHSEHPPLTRSRSMIVQPSVHYAKATDLSVARTPQNPEGSVIKDLLLKGRGPQQESLMGSSVVMNSTDPYVSCSSGVEEVQMVEIVNSDQVLEGATPVIVADGGTQHMAYLISGNQDHVPLNVAHDVEILSESPPRSKETSPAKVESLKKGKLKKAATIDTPFQNIEFEVYDPKTPPKRGRPKGSKNRLKELPGPISLPMNNSGILTKKFTLMKGLSGGTLVAASGCDGESPTPLPLIGTPQVVFPSTPTVSAPSPMFPMVVQASTPLPLASTINTVSVASSLATSLSSDLSVHGSVPVSHTQSRPMLHLNIPPPLGSIAGHSGNVTPNILGTPTMMSPAVGQVGTPLPETPTSQSLLKLKLKGKLLMRRSMSVERALSQERERQMQEARRAIPSPLVGKSPTRPHKQLEMLRRCESLDETSPLKKRKLMYQHSVHEESPSGLVAPFMSSMAPSPLAISVPSEKSLIPAAPAKSKEMPFSYPTPIRDLCLQMDVAKKADACGKDDSEKSSEPEHVPVVNEIMKVYWPSLPAVAPLLQASGQHILQLPVVSTLPSRWHNQLNGVLQAFVPLKKLELESKHIEAEDSEIRITLTDSKIHVEGKNDDSGDGDIQIIEIDRTEPNNVCHIKGELDQVPKIVVEGIQSLENDSSKSLEKTISQDGKSAPISLSKSALLSSGDGLHIKPLSPIMGGKWGGEKNAVQMLLSGHQHPVLRTLTHITFCTLSKPQPMYVPQGNNKKISMYSNWQVAKFNPNPMGLTTKMMLSLHHTRRCHIDAADAVSAITPVKQGVLTHSSYWNYYNRRKAALQVRQLQRQASEASLEVESKPEEGAAGVKESPELQLMTVNVIGEDNQQRAMKVPVVQSKHVQLPHDPSIEGYHTIPPEATIQVCVVDAMASKVAEGAETPTLFDQEPKREQVCKGGYKTDEKYVYVRGRGRGKYVCEECGIRCKKPSMLKKHIRTHTDLRPYHCHHCKFSFKTKGNLTKHMKSKAHHKKCLELGLNPIPVTVEDCQIDSEAIARQIELAKSGKGGHQEEYFLDDDDDDEDDEDEDGEIIEEEIVVIDEPDSSMDKTEDMTDETNSEGPHFIAVREVDSSKPMLVRIGSAGELVIEPGLIEDDGPKAAAVNDLEEQSPSKCDEKEEREGPRPSIDKEIAHSLLDLSKASKHAQNEEDGLKVIDQVNAQEGSVDGDDAKGNQRLDSLIKEVMTRTKPQSEGSRQTLTLDLKHDEGGDMVFPATTTSTILDKAGHASAPLSMVRMATTIYQSTSTIKHPVDFKLVAAAAAAGKPPYPAPRNTYANKIAALQSANEKDLSLHIGRSSVNITGSGFVPPILLASGEVRAPMESPRTPITPLTTVPIIGTLLKEFSMTTPGLSSIVSLGSEISNNPTSRPTSPVVEKQMNLCPLKREDSEGSHSSDWDQLIISEGRKVKEEGAVTPNQGVAVETSHVESRASQPSTISSQIKVSLSTTLPGTSIQSPTNPTIINFVTSENRAPFEILPIPGKVSENLEDLVDGKYLCNVCHKAFPKQHQLTLHKNIHYFERPFRCESCGISFRTKGHLQKHQRTESHLAKQNINQQFGVPSPDNPRPFRCEDCNIAFRIHGHLAKHLRSKSHITALEKMGKVPPGTYALIEKRDLNEIDATDCETTLESVLHMLDPSHMTALTSAKSRALHSGKSTVASSQSVEHEQASLHRKDSKPNSQASSPIREQFHYTRVGGYEKDFVASNERVTVEKINLEPIDFSHIGSTSSQGEGDAVRFEESEQDLERSGGSGSYKSAGTGSGKSSPQRPRSPQAALEKGPQKCGICEKTFKTVAVYKQHLVTHAELRPYVCEYCDAGFTTPQSLKFHLRTHTQERPYICGRCGDTFADSESLHQHVVIHDGYECSDGEDAARGNGSSKSGAAARDKDHASSVTKDAQPTDVPKTVRQSAEASVVRAAAKAVAAKASPGKSPPGKTVTKDSGVTDLSVLALKSKLSDSVELKVPLLDGKTGVLATESLPNIQFSVADEQTKAKVVHLLGPSASTVDRVEVLELKPEHVEALQFSGAGVAVGEGGNGDQVQILYLAESQEHGLCGDASLVTDSPAVLSLASSKPDPVRKLFHDESAETTSSTVTGDTQSSDSIFSLGTTTGTFIQDDVQKSMSCSTNATTVSDSAVTTVHKQSIEAEEQFPCTSKEDPTIAETLETSHHQEVTKESEPPSKRRLIEMPSGEKIAHSVESD